MSLMLLEALDAVIKSSLTSVMTGVQGTTCSGTISTIKINKNTYLKDGLEPVEFYHSNVLNGNYPWSNPSYLETENLHRILLNLGID